MHPRVKRVLATGLAVVGLSSVLLAPSPAAAITNGRQISATERGFMVSIGGVVDGRLRHLCGGALISPRVVVTAAHCSNPAKSASYRVRVAADRPDDTQITRQYTVSEQVVHDKLDVAVFILTEPVLLPQAYSIRLASAPPRDGEQVEALGYCLDVPCTGTVVSNGLRQDVARTLSGKYCKGVEFTVGKCTERTHVGFDREVQQGDSGGPVVAIRNGFPELVGEMVQSGKGKTYAVRIDHIRDWLGAAIAKANEIHVPAGRSVRIQVLARGGQFATRLAARSGRATTDLGQPEPGQTFVLPPQSKPDTLDLTLRVEPNEFLPEGRTISSYDQPLLLPEFVAVRKDLQGAYHVGFEDFLDFDFDEPRLLIELV